MDHRWLLRLALLTALLVLGPPTTLRGGITQSSRGVDALNVTLLHSGDGYGSVVPVDAGNAPCQPLNQPPYYSPTSGLGCYGGLARRSGVVAAVRGEVEASGGSVALVDAGNALLGSLYYATFGSEVIASYYNLMRYDAVKLEVHDFTSGLGQVANFTRLLTTGVNATATVVSSNVVHLNNDSRYVAHADGAQVMPYALVKLGGSGEVLGFVGTMAQGLGTMFANPGAIDSTPELVAMRTAVASLQNLGVNKIVASVSGASVADAIVDEVPGIDVLIVLSQLYGCPNTTSAGPYPTVRVMPWGQPVLIVGTGVNSGQYLGRLDIDFDDHGVIKSWRGAPIRLDDGSPVDVVMQADVVRRQAEVDQLAQRPLGSSLVDLAYEHRCMFGECTIGSWSVDVLRATGRTQVAFVNGGTMYGEIPAGNITYGQLQTALPLQNGELQTYRLAGRYLWQALENSFRLVTDTELNLNQGVGRFLQVSGLRVLYNPREAVGWRVVEVAIETAPGVWIRLDPEELYTVTSFRWVSVLGGDGYTMIRDNLCDLRPIGVTGATAYLTALTRGPITGVAMGRLNTTSLTTRSCYDAYSGLLCSGNGVCVLGRCQCAVGEPVELCAGRSSSDALSAGAIAGLVIGSAVVAACVLVSVVFITAVLASRSRKRPADQEWLIDFNELEIGDLLGRGGYGEVYRGKWKGTGVAVKTISAERITREMKASFIKETSIMSRLRHPNCVLFMAASTKPPLLCIVMEYMALGSLYDLLHNELVNEIPFVLRLKLMYQAAKGMHFLHSSGIVHRDLKSLNLLLDHKWNVKVADFGLTVFRDSVKRKGDGDRCVVGSVPWMAPELLQRDTDHRNPQAPIEFVQLVDVYSFGIILWEVLTRKRPYEGLSPSQVAVAVIRSDLRPTLPAGVLGLADHERQYLNLMSACWHRDPSVRPAFHRIMDTLVKINNTAGGGNSSSGSGFVFSSSSGSNSSGGGKCDGGEAAGGARGPLESMSLMSGRDLSSSRDSTGSYGNHDDGGSGSDGKGEERGKSATKADRVPRRDVSFAVCDLARFNRVWQRNPAAADKAIRRFGVLVRHHVGGCGGHIHSPPSLHSGGTFMVAFAQPTAAVAFALALQSDVQREEELGRHARVGITHRQGPCGAPADDRTRTTYHPRDYAECLQLAARCPPARVVCSGAFHLRFTDKAHSDSTSDHHQQPLRFTKRPDGSMRVSLDTTGDAEVGNEENDDVDQEEFEGDEAVCSSDRCPWIIDAESIELGECIGEGSFAEVLEGTCDGRPVAVKRLFNSRLDDHGMRKLRKEAAILSGVDHPQVVKLMGLSVGPRSLLLVMELVPRGSLRALLSNTSVGLKWPQRLAMLRDAALGLAFLHARGIVHRDIKSSNLLVDDDLRVKVADFGFATVKQDNCTMTRCGSPSWTAPEVLAPVFTTAAESGRNGDDDDDDDDGAEVVVDERVYSEKADVYSFGIVMWEVLTRQIPYAEGNLTTVAFDVIQGKRPPVPSDCPPAYADTMRRCWREKPRKRPAMDDVLAFFAGQVGDLAHV